MFLLVPLLLAAVATVEPPRDWRMALLADGAAFHDDIRANHPGMVNAADPGFARREARAYARLRQRARVVTTDAGYRYALKEYTASFDDGHVQLRIGQGGKPSPPRWPGFVTGFDEAGAQRVELRALDALVPLGARLDSCDGVAAAALAARNVGAFEGRWGLKATRLRHGASLLVDDGNPFIRRPATCVFDVGGAPRRVTLQWRPIGGRMERAEGKSYNGPFAQAYTLVDGTRWFVMRSFDGAPNGLVAPLLRPIIAEMGRHRATLVKAPAIVLDIRGNSGGSSDWSRQIAAMLWGPKRLAELDALPDPTYAEWRTSPAVEASVIDYRRRAGAGADPRLLAYMDTVAAGLASARAAGRPLWREPRSLNATLNAGIATPAASAGSLPLTAPVYVVTSSNCVSACLDAVDLWRRLGAIHIGEETSADTFYMEIRYAKLPSGIAEIAVPRKVHRGRPRGSNEPVVPHHRFAGDVADTPVLERWIAALPTR